MLANQISTKTLTLLLIITFFAFFLIASLYIDPDFGWELMTGRYLIQNGFPATDPFSYTMPDYPIILHSWIPEVKYALMFPYIGYMGLAAISALVVSITFLIVGATTANSDTKPIQSMRWYTMLPWLLFFTTLLQYADVRPQVFSWLFYSVLLFIIYNERRLNTFKWLIPVLFMIWANTHGAFALGLAILTIHTFTKTKKSYHDGAVLLLSVLATFVNPFGIHIWREVFLTFGDPNIRSNISEWIPTLFRISLIDVLVVVTPSVFIVKYFRIFRLPQRIIFIITLLAGLSSLKLLPFYAISVTPLFIQALNILYIESKKIITLPKFNLYIKGLLGIVLVASIINIGLTIVSYNNLSEKVFYPQKAVVYLQNNPPKEQLLSSFSWAGYTLLKLPEYKVFVDGRMPFWDTTTSQIGASSNSKNALADYHKILNGDLNLLEKHNVNTILYHNNPSHKAFYEALEKNKWKKIYSDEVAVIYIRR